MAGLLSALAGGLKGLGDGMVEQAKQARIDKLAELLRSNQVEDRDAGFQQAKTMQGNQFTQDDKSQGALFTHEDTSQRDQFGQQDKISDKTIAANKANTAATLKAEGDRQAAGFTHDDATAASQISNITQAADGTMYGTNKNGQAVPITDKATGKPVMASTTVPSAAYAAAIKSATDDDGTVDQGKLTSALQAIRAASTPGAVAPPAPPAPGYLSNLWGAVTGSPNATPSTGGGLTSNINGAPPAAPSFNPGKATATATNPKTGAKIFQVGNQWVDSTGAAVK